MSVKKKKKKKNACGFGSGSKSLLIYLSAYQELNMKLKVWVAT